MEILAFIGVLLWADGIMGYADNSVLIKSKYNTNQFVTSSTLKWVGAENGNHPKTAVIGSTEIVIDENMAASPVDLADGEDAPEGTVERQVYVCRVKLVGIYVPGQLRYGKQGCEISFHGKVSSHEKYEVLENVENGGRLTWVWWDEFSTLQVGTVAAGDYFIARRKFNQDSGESAHKGSGLKHLMGKLGKMAIPDGFGQLSVITPENSEADYKDGEVLVETEPVRYELTSINFNLEKQRTKKTLQVLGTTQLINDKSEEPARLDTVIAYSNNYSNYWGQGRAILNGLPTIVRLTNGTPLEEIKWGIRDTEARSNVHRVETHLDPGTGVNVTLYGNDTEIETPYTAKLVAVYRDTANRARTVHGSRCEVAMLDVTPVFSQPFFLGNNSLVPTTTTTTTTTTKATTTTMITTVISSTKKPVTTENGASSATSGKKSENSSMMNDEGAEAVKKQEAQEAGESKGQDSTGVIPHPPMILILLLAALPSASLLLHRIT